MLDQNVVKSLEINCISVLSLAVHCEWTYFIWEDLHV